MSQDYDYDLFVIGAGSGGVRASRIAASLGASVAVCEDHRVGGTCVIRGCVPKKLFAYASHFHEDFADAEGYGWKVGETHFDFATLQARKDREIDRLNGIYIKLLENAGVGLIEGRGQLIDAHTVEVGGKQYRARKILIAVGASPWSPQIPGHELAYSSDDVFERWTELPQRILVYGGGYIAVEFAAIFHGMGSDVTMAFRADNLLREFDEDVRCVLRDDYQAKGIDLRPQTSIARLESAATGVRAHFDDNTEDDFDAVLFATGRRPVLAGLGLEQAGVEVADGHILVDRYSRTSAESIFAVGDVTDRMALTPVALMEGEHFARTEFGGEDLPVDHEWVPTAVFGQPQIATVGFSEEQARNRFGEVDVYKSTFRPLKHTLSGREERTLIKLIVDPVSDRVLGCHIVGMDAAEMMQGVAVAVKLGATKRQFDQTIGIHPTSAEEFVTLRNKA